MSRAAAINDAMRPAGRVPAAGMPWADAESCPDCHGDVFACTCQPWEHDGYTADDLAAAVAESDAKRAKAVADARIAAGLVKDLQARVKELERATTSASTVAAGRATAALPAARAALAAAETPAFPGNLGAYLANLVDPPRIAYATELAAHLVHGADAPAPVDASWFDRVDAKVRRLASVHVGR